MLNFKNVLFIIVFKICQYYYSFLFDKLTNGIIYSIVLRNKRQQKTLKRVFEIPTRADIKWKDIKSLLTACNA